MTMMSRLMLNLHRSVAEHDPDFITRHAADSSNPSDNSTTLLFTSRISMPPTMTGTWDQEASRYRESAYVRDMRSGYGLGYIEEVHEMQDVHYVDRDDASAQVVPVYGSPGERKEPKYPIGERIQ